MAWACCKNGWLKDSKQVIGRQTRSEKKGRPTLKRMNDVKLDLTTIDVRIGRTRTLDRM
jgi:hypothetical protein